MSADVALAVPSSNGTSTDIPHLSSTEPTRDMAVVSPPKNKGGRPKKPPSESKVYKVVIAVLALRAQGVRPADIAAQLGYSELTIRTYLKRANRRGWLTIESFDDPEDTLEFILKDKVVKNVKAGLEERTEEGQLTAGARLMTIEAAKGLGMFKQHQVVKGDLTTNVGVALRVQVEMPPVIQSPIRIQPGTTGGSRAIEIPANAEIIEPTEE